MPTAMTELRSGRSLRMACSQLHLNCAGCCSGLCSFAARMSYRLLLLLLLLPVCGAQGGAWPLARSPSGAARRAPRQGRLWRQGRLRQVMIVLLLCCGLPASIRYFFQLVDRSWGLRDWKCEAVVFQLASEHVGCQGTLRASMAT
jgi:hypothetical protein